MNKIKEFFKKITLNVKKNIFIYLGITISSFAFVYGSSIFVTPFDGQVENEITERITSGAQKSEFNLTLNSLELTARGNSDFYIYSNNKLQDFQMLNQQYKGERSYAFAAYKPANNRIPFRYNNFDCSSILFESKFEPNNFYFDLPLLCGSLPRTTDKHGIYLTDSFANKIKGTSSLDSLIKKEITGQTINIETSSITYRIIGIFSTENKLGSFLKNFFGENLIFIPEYTSFQMKGALYFVGSTNKKENKSLVNFVYQNYKSSSSNSRDLETGYSVTYKFYDYNPETNSFELGNTNDILNRIIEGYSSRSVLLAILGAILLIVSLALTLFSCFKEKKRLSSDGKGIFLFMLWLTSCLSLLFNSIVYKIFPIVGIITGTSFITRSTVTSSAIFLSWILLTCLLSIVPILKLKVKKY